MTAKRKAHPPMHLVVSCEHASQAVPAQLLGAFSSREARALLTSHHGWDPGSPKLARTLAAAFHAPLFVARASRLVVDLNRSPGHPRLYSKWVRALPPAEREAIMRRHYLPHRHAVEQALRDALAGGKSVLHLGAHSFTPVLRGQIRRADVGILYDPARPRERAFAASLKRALGVVAPELVVRRNYPYRGTDDGFTTYLRRALAHRYLGIEIELNQRHLGSDWTSLCRTVAEAVASCLPSSPRR